MKFVSGIAIGLIFGLAATAGAQTIMVFASKGRFMTWNDTQQTYYVLGVHDAMETLADRESAGKDASNTVKCMDSVPGQARALTAWALRRLANANVTLNNSVVDAIEVLLPDFPCSE